MKGRWITQPLAELADIRYGTRVVRKKDGGAIYPVYGGGGATFQMDTFNREDCFIVSRFGMSADCVRKVEGRFFLNDSGLSVSSRSPDRVLQAFLDLQLFANQPAIYALGKGTAQKNLDVPQFKELLISYPENLEEQRQIVAVLDEAFAAIATATANAEKNLANARELFVSQREQILRNPPSDWLEAPLSDLCSVKHGFAFKSEYFGDSGEKVLLTPGNFFEAGGYRDRGAKQKFYDGPMPNGFTLQGDDLLVAMTEQAAGLLGSPILVPSEGIFLHNQRLGLVQPKPGIDWSNEFFFHVFNTVHVRDQLHRTGTGQKVRHTSPAKIGEVIVRLPRSRHEQLAVAQQLDELWAVTELLSDVQNGQCVNLEKLKRSILHHAFTGELITIAPIANDDDFRTPAFAANVIAFAYRRHVAQGTEATFGHVKAQKALHLCESVGQVDMGRYPIKDAAGPNDFQHMLAAEEWAKSNQFFEFVPRANGKGYTFRKLARFETMAADGLAALKPVQDRLEKAIAPIAPMKSEEAELLATVHAAWNNLILDGVDPTDDAIIYEARENWHPAKLKFDRSKFRTAIATIRAKDIIPDGTAKRVGGQESLF